MHGVATESPDKCGVEVPPESCLFHDGFSGSVEPGKAELHGTGGFISGTWGQKVSIILDGVIEISFSNLPGYQHQFIGLIDNSIAGFRSFEFRETDGTTDQWELIWGDDFTFAILPPIIGCSGDVVTISYTTISFGVTECIATSSITVGPDVLVKAGAKLWLYAPRCHF